MNGAVGGCWCMYWRIGRTYREKPREENKTAFREIVERGPPPGLLAFDGDLAHRFDPVVVDQLPGRLQGLLGVGLAADLVWLVAELAIGPLAAHSRGEKTWRQTRHEIARACDNAFARRLRWAWWLQWMMFTPVLRTGLGSLALNSDWLWRTMFARTR